jgi:hypothetical protein
MVVTKKTMTGTTPEFAGTPATSKPVTLRYVDFLRIRHGQIVEHWLAWIN